jgi:hypothetical protein
MRSRVAFVFLTLAMAAAYAGDETIELKGREIVLHENGTWEYLDLGPSSAALEITLERDPSIVGSYKSRNGKYQVFLNSDVWEATTGINKKADLQFVNKDETGYGVVIFDGLSIPLESMEQVLIGNANNVDPNARIEDIRKCLVNGTGGELVTYLVSSKGMDFTFYSFIATKETGSVQVTFYTLSSYFEKLKPVFQEAISGFVFGQN